MGRRHSGTQNADSRSSSEGSLHKSTWYTSFLKHFGRVKLSEKTRKMSVRHDVAEPAGSGLNTSNLTDVGARHHAGPVKVAIHQSQTGVQPSSSETCG